MARILHSGGRLARTALLAGALMMVATGCGGLGADGTAEADGTGGGAGTDGDPNDFGLGPRLTVVFDVSGEASLQGSTTGLAPSGTGQFLKSCAEYGKGTNDDGRTIFVLPQFLDGQVSGKKVLIGAKVSEYNGPGDYGLDGLAGVGGEATIDVDGRAYAKQPDTTTGKLVVKADGSGTWTFNRLAVNDGSGTVSEGLTGTVSWTCKG